MATELASAFVQIVPSADGISSGIASALGSAVDTEGEKAGSKLSSILGNALKGGAIVTGFATAVAGGFAAAANSTAQYGDKIDKMSQKIGISAQSYQQWDYVMARAGTSVDNLQAGMKTLSSAAVSGSDAFQKLGISQSEVASMGKEDLFNTVIRSLASMEDGAERSTLATQLLGRAGNDLAPLLNEGTAAIDEQMQMALDYGMVLSNDAVAAAATYEDSLTTLQNTFAGIKNGLTADFLPAMSSVMDGLSLIFSGQDGGVAKVNEGFTMFLEGMINHIPDVISTGATLITTLASALVTSVMNTDWKGIGLQLLDNFSTGIKNLLGIPSDSGFEVIKEMGQGMLDNLPQMAEAAGQMIGRFVQTIGNNLPQILRQGIEIIGKIVSGIIDSIPKVVATVGQIISNFIKGFKSSGTSFSSIGKDIISGIASGISNAVSGMVDSAIRACKKLVEGVKNFFGIHSPSRLMSSQIGRFIPEGVAVGITDNIGSVEDAMEEMNGAILGTAQTSAYMPAFAVAGGEYHDANAFGGVTINVYAAEGQSVREIAEEVSEIIQHRVERKAVAF